MATSDLNQKMFNPELETVGEFLERFQLQNSLEPAATSKSDGASNKNARLLGNALPIHVITDIQRRLDPIKISAATYDQIVTNLVAAFETKTSIVGATVKFIPRKQQEGES